VPEGCAADDAVRFAAWCLVPGHRGTGWLTKARVSGGWYRSRRTGGGGWGCRARSSHSASPQPPAPDRWGCVLARTTATSLRGAVGYRSGRPGQSYPKRLVSRAPCHGQLSQGGRAELADLSWGQPGAVGGLPVGDRPEQHHAQQQPLARGQPIGVHQGGHVRAQVRSTQVVHAMTCPALGGAG